jgi:tight adherence protein B
LRLSLENEGAQEVPLLVRRANPWARFQALLAAADCSAPPFFVALAVLGICGVLAVASIAVLDSPVLAVVAPAALITILVGWAQHLSSRKAAAFDQQLADALSLVARSLRAGHPLLSGFGLVAEEAPRPVRDVFASVCQQQALGIRLQDALRSTAAKHPSPDLELFVTSVIIQLESGGNLADLMDRLTDVIRDRMRLGRRVKVLTAQTQLSKRILIGLPFLVFLGLSLISPAYMEPLYETQAGRVILAIGGASLLAGVWLMKRIAVVRY